MAVDTGQPIAFEGAQGFGAETQGGRGGEIVKVTNLNDSGTGSLRWALEDLDHPRIVVFDVGGTINLKDQIEINGDVTVAGQTAPGGITIAGGRLRVVESEVIIRGLNIRPGDDKDGDDPDNRDGISVGKSGREIENVIIDSNSISWAIDEALTTWGDNKNITFSNNIVAESLHDSLHPKGGHSMGVLVGAGSSNVSIVGNLIAHNTWRNAQVKDDAKQIEFINNVVYNYGDTAFSAHESTTAHVINNVFIAGVDSNNRSPIRLVEGDPGAGYYVSGNIGDITGSAMSKIQSSYVFPPATTDIVATSDVIDHVLAHVGADASDRNDIDARIIQAVKDGTGEIIDSPDEVGGYGSSPTQAALVDTDDDGIPDDYEAKIGSDAQSADAHDDADGDGTTNIDAYLNGLIDGFGPTPTDEGPKEGPVEGPPDEGEGEPGNMIVVEAEALQLTEGFKTRELGSASGDEVIEASKAQFQQAELAFEGAAGLYSLVIDYFDETDGVSTLTVQVNGEAVATWDWDADLGSDKANDFTLTSKVIDGLALAPGDTIQLLGHRDGREPLRIDKLTFAPDGTTPDPEPEIVLSAEDAVHVEAEDFTLTGFRVANLNAAENGAVIVRSGKDEHRAELAFDGKSGSYDVLVHYFDENDGESELSLSINGNEVADWDWDAQLGHANANRATLTTKVIEGVDLKTGDLFSMVGMDDGSEPLRIDAVEFIPGELAFMA